MPQVDDEMMQELEEEEQFYNRKSKKKELVGEIRGEKVNIWSPSPSFTEEDVGVKNFDLSNLFLSQQFVDFLYEHGVDIQLLDPQTLTNLKRKYGQVELSKARFQHKQAALNIKLQHLKYHHYKAAFSNFFH